MNAQRSKQRFAWIAAAVCLFAVVGVFAARKFQSQQKVATETAVVRSRSFVHKVPAVGDVATYRPVTVYNECRHWPRRILDIVPMGSWVEKGDVVCVLDSSEFRDELYKPVLAVIADDARLEKSNQDELLEKLRGDRMMDTQVLESRKAEMDRDKFKYGSSVNEIRRLTGEISKKKEDFEQTLQDFSTKERLARLGVTPQTSVARANTVVRRKDREVDLAIGEVNLKEKYDHPRSMMQLDRWTNDSKNEVDRLGLRNDMRVTMAKFMSLSFTKYRAGWQSYVDMLTEKIAACEIRAPKSGQVIYPTTHENHRRILIGNHAHYHQEMFSVIDRSRLTINAKISDRYYQFLKKGQPVEIRAEATPGKIFHGKITFISTYAEKTDKFTPHLRYHRMQILFDEDSNAADHLFPGMTADIQVIVENRQGLRQVPTNAVFEYNRRYATIIVDRADDEDEDERYSLRYVEIGVTNDQFTEIVGGLDDGERVLIESAEKQRALADKL